MKVPIKLWMLLMPLEDVERQQVVDAVVKALPGEKQELEKRTFYRACQRGQRG